MLFFGDVSNPGHHSRKREELLEGCCQLSLRVQSFSHIRPSYTFDSQRRTEFTAWEFFQVLGISTLSLG